MNVHAHSGPTPRGRGVSEALMAGSVITEHRSAIAPNFSFPISNNGQEILGVAVLNSQISLRKCQGLAKDPNMSHNT